VKLPFYKALSAAGSTWWISVCPWSMHNRWTKKKEHRRQSTGD